MGNASGTFARMKAAVARANTVRKRFINRVHVLKALFPVRNLLSGRRPVRVSVAGQVFRIVPAGAEAFHVWSGLRLERDEIGFVVACLKTGDVFLDVGSNVGLFSLAAASRLAALGGGRVFAFEPCSTTVSRLERNLALNRAAGVTVVRTALADKTGSLPLNVNAPGKDSLNTLGNPTHPESRVVGAEMVPVTTLDEWAKTNGVSRVDLIKMDVEGAELAVIEGARATLSGDHPPLIVYESAARTTEGFGYQPSAIARLLESLGYEVRLLAGGRAVPRPSGVHEGTMIAVQPSHLERLAGSGLAG